MSQITDATGTMKANTPFTSRTPQNPASMPAVHKGRVRARSVAYNANSQAASTAYSWLARIRKTNAIGSSCSSHPSARASCGVETALAMATTSANDST